MSLSTLSGDAQGIILDQLRNTVDPRLVMYFSSASKELRALLTPAMQQQLRTDYEEATAALCLKMGMRDCKELREATEIVCMRSSANFDKYLSAADLMTLAKLGSVLPALKRLTLAGWTGVDGVQRLAEGLVPGALPALTHLSISFMQVGEAGAWAIAAALDRGALPRLKDLQLDFAYIGDAGLAALAPALRRRPALKRLRLSFNPFGDEGLAAVLAPPQSAGTPPPPAGGLKKLKELRLRSTEITDAGCAALAAALDSGALPALEELELGIITARATSEAREAVRAALARSRARRAGRCRRLFAVLGLRRRLGLMEH